MSSPTALADTAAHPAAGTAVGTDDAELFDVLTACGWSADDAHSAAVAAQASELDPAERRWSTDTQYAHERRADARAEYDYACTEYARGPLYADADSVDRAADALAREETRHRFHRAHRDTERLHELAQLAAAHAADRGARFAPDPRRFAAPAAAWRALARAVVAALAFLRPALLVTEPAAPTSGPARASRTSGTADSRLSRVLVRALTAAPSAPPLCAVAARA